MRDARRSLGANAVSSTATSLAEKSPARHSRIGTPEAVIRILGRYSLTVTISVYSALALGRAAVAGPITPNPADPTWLLHDGVPFFLCGPGDPENFFHRGTLLPDGTRNGDQDLIVQKIIGTGANVAWMTAVRSHGGDGDATHNPFVGHDPNAGVNELVLDQWETWIGALDAAGIVTFFVFYDDSSRPWNTGSTVSAAEANFFQTVVNRFETYDHLIWCVAEEYNEAYTVARISALAALIASTDDAGHPVSAHQVESTQFHFADDASMDAFAMHTGGGNTVAQLHAKVLSARNYADGRYHVIMAESIGHYSNRTDARRLSWAAAMGGSYVIVHNMDVINTPVEAIEDCGRIVSFFESTPFSEMEPRDDLARLQTDFVFGDPAVGYILYAAAVAGNLGLSIPPGGAGDFILHWFDVANGTTIDEPPVVLGEGDRAFTPPSGLGADVAVFVEAVNVTSASASVVPRTWGGVKSMFRRGSEPGGE
jgi:hypothetical protein